MPLENREQRENIARKYKKKLKDRLLEFNPGAIFVNKKQKNKLEQIIIKVAKSEAVGTFNDSILIVCFYHVTYEFESESTVA